MSKEVCSYPVVSIIAFNHARGPEIEQWIGVENENEISEWPLLPFLALTDGAHSSTEDFSYFTLKHSNGDDKSTTLFGISCTRQLDSRELIDRPADVTRSTVQKAVVVIADSPTVFFGHLKQQLSAVTQAWFAQRNFEDIDIIKRFQESLKVSLNLSLENDKERDHFVGLPLRELVYEFKHQALVLFKCMLLQPKMLFFSSRGERLCMTQFSLLSLIPGLLRNLQDCSDPELDTYESTLVKPTSVRTSDRRSLLAFMGLPLQIFGKGSLFGPYTPLQQLDVLADVGTKSYIVGSTNSLLLQQKDRYSDILINLEEASVNITSTSLRTALALSAADRRWIDSLVQSVTESWDDADPSRPKTMGFVGSEDYIRLQFEEYILSMVSAVKYHLFLEKHAGRDLNVFLPDIEGDPSSDFNPEFVDYWKKTENFRIFQKFTEPEIFDLVPPKHVMAGGLSVEDVQRRIAQQVHELGLDEKVSAGKEAVAKTWATGRSNLSLAFTNISKNVEYYREQRRLQAQQAQQTQTQASENAVPENSPVPTAPTSPTSETPSKAGTYFSSWATWAGEKRKKAFAGTTSPPPEAVVSPDSVHEKVSSKSSLFSRWSKGSIDLENKLNEDVRETGSTEIVRETVWDENESSKCRLDGKELPEIRKSLPPPPLPAKDISSSPKVGSEVQLPPTDGAGNSLLSPVLREEPVVQVGEITAPFPDEAPITSMEKEVMKPLSDERPVAKAVQKVVSPLPAEELGTVAMLLEEKAIAQLEKETIRPTSQEKSATQVVLAKAEIFDENARPTVIASEFAAASQAESVVESNSWVAPELRSTPEPHSESNEPKVDSIVKRLSLKLAAEPGVESKPTGPTSPTKRDTAPKRASVTSSLAARRAMFEKR